MKKNKQLLTPKLLSNLILTLFLLSSITFAYLSYHHYDVKLGLSDKSLCNINEALNCDAAALSSYSEVAHIPIAVIGFCYSVLFFLFFSLIRLGWMEETVQFKSFAKLITGFSASLSILLLLISIFKIGVYCPFCFLTYLFSFLIFIFIYLNYKSDPFEMNHLVQITSEKGLLTGLVLIPLFAWFISGSVRDHYGLAELEKYIPEKMALWQNSQVFSFDTNLGIVKGNTSENERVIVEFADFKCPHCKTAASTFKKFMASQTNTNQKVKFIFKPYPLDANCNPSLKGTPGDGTRCELAGWVLCAEKIFQKGWAVHDWIFEHQSDLIYKSEHSSDLIQMGQDLGLQTDQIQTCSKSTETYDLIKKTANEGALAQITGTPTIYYKGKKLDGGQILSILKAALEY